MAIKIKKKKYKQTKIERERQRRIVISLWAYAYEFRDQIFVGDAEFDKVCNEIDLDINTGNEEMDDWFREHFYPDTGQWIHDHPHLERLEEIYQSLKHLTL